MSVAAKLAAKLANEDIQVLFAERLLEPVIQGGRYADLLKLWELAAALPNPDGDGRPMREQSDEALYGLLREISEADSASDEGGHPGGVQVPESGCGAVFRA